MNEKDKLTADDVRACIRTHFGPVGEQYAVLFEVRNGTAWRANRSVDAVVMSLWPSLGMELWGMEIKVSRSDWYRELKDPAKASDVFPYFDRWFLVAPKHVVHAPNEEIPQPWGWFSPQNGRLVQERPAAKNEAPKAIDRHVLGALLRNVSRSDDGLINIAVDKALREQRATFDKEIDKRALERQGELKKDAEQWSKLRELLKRKPDDYIYLPEVIDALRVIMKSGIAASWNSLRSLKHEVDRMQGRLAEIADELGIKDDDKRGRAGPKRPPTSQ